MLGQNTLTLSQTTNLDASKLKKFADYNFKFDEIKRKISKWVENTVENEKLLITSKFSFSNSVFKTFVLRTRKNQGFFGKGLTFTIRRHLGQVQFKTNLKQEFN